jgi:hypothetical protein
MYENTTAMTCHAPSAIYEGFAEPIGGLDCGPDVRASRLTIE